MFKWQDTVVILKPGSTYGFCGKVAGVGNSFMDVTTDHPYYDGHIITLTYHNRHLMKIKVDTEN